MPKPIPNRPCYHPITMPAAALLVACGLAFPAPNSAAQSAAPSAQPPAAAAPTPTAKPPAPAREFQGCVQPSPIDKTVLVLSTDTVCARLVGSLATPQLTGHQIDLKGVLTPRTRDESASIRVDSVVSVGKPCSDVCSLRPPGTRGLGGGETPGKEGGTPGLTTPQPQ
jgi:hypothetical protein